VSAKKTCKGAVCESADADPGPRSGKPRKEEKGGNDGAGHGLKRKKGNEVKKDQKSSRKKGLGKALWV